MPPTTRRAAPSALGLSLFALVATTGPARADIVNPNVRYITHTIRLDNVREYAGKWRFYVVTRQFSNKTRASAEPLSPSGEINGNSGYWANSLHLGAVAKDVKVSGDVGALFSKPDVPGVLISAAIPRTRSVPKSDPHTALRTRYRVVLKTPPAGKTKPAPALALAKVSDEWAANGGVPASPGVGGARRGWLLGVPLLALVGLFGRLRRAGGA